MAWHLCSTKNRPIDADSLNRTEETNNIQKNIAATSVFDIDIPEFGYFERQMEFIANLGTSKLVSIFYNTI